MDKPLMLKNLNLRIEEAIENEINVIQYIAYNTWPHTYKEILSKSQLEYMLGLFYSTEALNEQFEQGHIFLLAWDGDRPIGFAGIEHQYLGSDTTRIHKLYILPDSQGSGAGRLLIAQIEKLAHLQKSRKISLNVNRFNAARLFYEKHGFSVVAEEDIQLPGGYLMEDYVMEKRL